MDPLTAALVFGGLQVAGALSSANAQKKAGEAEQAAYNVNAAMVEQRGEQEESAARDKLRRLMGTQRAAYAKAGVDLSSGSPLSLLAFTKAEGEKEALNIRLEAQKEAAVGRWTGAQAAETAKQKANATLLTGLGQAGSTAFSVGGGAGGGFKLPPVSGASKPAGSY